uniref:Uncharacterized protein n=1 Tax=Anguilla anguilla TaxID=7936 RepID=A0A0E9WHX2_ANGAN
MYQFDPFPKPQSVPVMKPARVLRPVLGPEPEKVNPLVLPGQPGDELLGCPTV